MRVSLVCLLLICAFAVACDDNAEPTATTTASASGTAKGLATTPSTPSPPAPTMIPGARDPVFAPDAPFPESVALIVETGCWQCDGPATGLYRVYRDPTGGLRIDSLGERIRQVQDFRHFLTFDASTDGSRLTASVCISGECGDVAVPVEPPITGKFMSDDGGMTWTALEVEGGVVAVLRERVVLRQRTGPGDADGRFVEYPSGSEIARPFLADPTLWPFAFVPNELRWLANDGRALVREDASVSYIFGQHDDTSIAKDARIRDAYLAQDESSLFLTIIPGGFTTGEIYLALTGTNDPRVRSLMRLGDFLYAGAALDGATLLANITSPAPEYIFLPSLIDMDAFTISPIRDPFATDDRFKGGRNYVRAIARGPFARVNTPGDCLNIRATTSVDVNVPPLACAADGVLLEDLAITLEEDGRVWRSVLTPSGIQGWADAAFLEAAPNPPLQ